MTTDSPNTEEMLQNVMHSTESALLALSHLEKSLVRGRFKEGMAPYAAMCKTLVGQRIWTGDKNHKKINQNFKQISNISRNIIDILLPYIENLKTLAVIDGDLICKFEQTGEIAAGTEGEAGTDEGLVADAEKVLDAVKKSPKKLVSYSRLRSTLGWERKRLDQVLKTMAEDNHAISITRISSRRMIGLSK